MQCMKGTSLSATAPIRLTPPSRTNLVSTAMTTPDTHRSMPNAASNCPRCCSTAPCCRCRIRQPAKQRKCRAEPAPVAAASRPFLIRIHRAADLLAVVIGFAVVDSDEDFGVPSGHADDAVIHIQNRAPGPPTAIAVATPAMLPVPTVAASAVINAAWCDFTGGARCGVATAPHHDKTGADPGDRHQLQAKLQVDAGAKGWRSASAAPRRYR